MNTRTSHVWTSFVAILLAVLSLPAPITASVDAPLLTQDAYPDTPPILITLIPDRLAWDEGETITGKIIFTNRSNAPITIDTYNVAQPTVYHANGSLAKLVNTHVFISTQDVHVPEPIQPGAEGIAFIRIKAEPRASGPSITMPPGAYFLKFEGSICGGTVDFETAPVHISVLPRKDSPIGSRIVWADMKQDRLVTVRESGTVDVHDAKSHRHLSRQNIPKYATKFGRTFVLSPGAKTLAAHTHQDTLISILKLDGYTEPREIGWVGTETEFHGFDDTGTILRASTKDATYEVNINTGVATLRDDWFRTYGISPDGKFSAAGWFEDAIMQQRDGTLVAGRWPCLNHRLLTDTGIYGPAGYGVRLWTSYDGLTSKEFTGAGAIPVAESRDGSLVIWDGGKETAFNVNTHRFSVYQTSDQQELWGRSDDCSYATWFTSDSNRIVIGRWVAIDDGKMNWPNYLSDHFEVVDGRTGKKISEFTLGASWITDPLRGSPQRASHRQPTPAR